MEPVTAPPSMTDLYIQARTQGMDDTNAALAVAQHLRQQADLRSGFREAGAVASGRPYDATADRAGLMSEANAPIADLQQQRAVEPLAFDQAKHASELAGSDFALQQQRALLDPSHPTNVATREILAKSGINVPPNLVAPALPKELWAQISPLVEQQSKNADRAALEPGRRADAAKANADAAASRAMTGPNVAKANAEATKANAEAAQLGNGKPIPPEVAQKIQNQAEALKAIDTLEKLHGEVGGTGYIPGVHVGAEGRYNDAIKSLSSAVAAGALPLGRETPAAIEEFQKQMPSGMLPHDRAKAQFALMRETIRSNADAQLKQLQAGHFSQDQSAVIGQGLKPPATPAAKPAPTKTAMPVISAKSEYDALPAGTRYVGPDGKVATKKGAAFADASQRIR